MRPGFGRILVASYPLSTWWPTSCYAHGAFQEPDSELLVGAMAALVTTSRQLLDLVTESVARRSGLLLCDSDVRALLRRGHLRGAAPVLTGTLQRIRVRMEFVDDLIRALRAGIGNLPDAEPGFALTIRSMNSVLESGLDPAQAFPILEEFSARAAASGTKRIDGAALVDEIVSRTSLPGWAAEEFVRAVAGRIDRDTNISFNCVAATWDGATPLAQLFKAEIAPTDPDSYLDQKFLDYLVANEDKLDRVHWRNFERLVAEVFQRRGYAVTLGRGTKDGGVDVRVWADKRKEGPPLLVIQCKRHKKGDAVEIQWVKALWADLVAEGAEGGLIATTSTVSKDGKKLCEARRYPLTFAENRQIVEWTRGTWRYSWTGKTSSPHLGRYLLQPFQVLSPVEE